MPPETATREASSDKFFARKLKQWFLRSSHINKVQTLSPNFRLIDLQGEALKKASWSAGQHIQISMGVGMEFRTYTPIS